MNCERWFFAVLGRCCFFGCALRFGRACLDPSWFAVVGWFSLATGDEGGGSVMKTSAAILIALVISDQCYTYVRHVFVGETCHCRRCDDDAVLSAEVGGQ